MSKSRSKVISTAQSFAKNKYNHQDCAALAIKAGGEKWYAGTEVAWCDICVSAILYKAGFTKAEMKELGYPQATINTQTARKNGRFHYTKNLASGSKIPTGSIVLFRWNKADDDNFDHVGILVENSDGYKTIEGNASDDGLIHEYTRAASYIKAYIEPKYTTARRLEITGKKNAATTRACSLLLNKWGYPIKEVSAVSSLMIKCWQTHLKNYGYYSKEVDGKILASKDSKYSWTIAGTQKLLKNKGFYSGSCDGVDSADLIKAFQKYLNSYVDNGTITL